MAAEPSKLSKAKQKWHDDKQAARRLARANAKLTAKPPVFRFPDSPTTPSQSEPIDIIVRKTYAQTTALFAKVHNLQVEISQLRSDLTKAFALFASLRDAPEAPTDFDFEGLSQISHVYQKPK